MHKYLMFALFAICVWVVAEFTAVLIMQEQVCYSEARLSRLILPTSRQACKFE